MKPDIMAADHAAMEIITPLYIIGKATISLPWSRFKRLNSGGGKQG